VDIYVYLSKPGQDNTRCGNGKAVNHSKFIESKMVSNLLLYNSLIHSLTHRWGSL